MSVQDQGLKKNVLPPCIFHMKPWLPGHQNGFPIICICIYDAYLQELWLCSQYEENACKIHTVYSLKM